MSQANQIARTVAPIGRFVALFLSLIAAGAAEVDVSKLPPPAQTEIDFDRDIAPIFEASCLRCHGTERPRSRFSLASREAALKGGENGVDIIPGESAKSPLIHFVARLDEEMEMPPSGKAEPLTTPQVALLRAWIDQGAKWSQKAPEPKFKFSMTPTVRWIQVNGDKRQFQDHAWTKDGWAGGVTDFSWEENLKPGEKFSAQGSVLADMREYKLKLSYEKSDVGFIRGGYEQYRRYYDDTGGYYAPFGTDAFSLGRDLVVDIGRAWVDIGLTLPHWPRMVFGYEYQFKEGTKSSLTWSDVGFDLSGPNPVLRATYPGYKDVDEQVHIVKFDISHTLGGIAIEDNFRAEFYNLSTERVALDFFEIGTPLPDSASRTREDYDHVEIVNTLTAQKEIREWLFVSGGYLYSKLDGDSRVNMEFFMPSDPLTVLFTRDAANPITLERESHVLNVNSRLGPWEGLTFSAGMQSEWTREDGLGRGLQTPSPRVYGSDKDTFRLGEDLGLRFTRIPATVLYADAHFEQEWIDHYERDDRTPTRLTFLRDTDADSDFYEYRTGFTVSPWRAVMFASSYKHRLRTSDYDHHTDLPGASAVNGYSAFIDVRDVELDEIEAKVTLRPTPWLKTTLKYQLVATDYRTTTDPSTVTLFDPITSTPIVSPQPGGEILAGNYDAHIYSVNATITPWRRLYLTTTFSYSDARTVSGVSGRAGVVPYDGDVYSVLTTASFALNNKTDLHATYTFSKADYRQNNEAVGLPLGVEYDRHGVIAGVTHRFKKNLSTNLQYGYFQYDEPTAGGANDYTAHAVFASMTMTLP